MSTWIYEQKIIDIEANVSRIISNSNTKSLEIYQTLKYILSLKSLLNGNANISDLAKLEQRLDKMYYQLKNAEVGKWCSKILSENNNTIFKMR